MLQIDKSPSTAVLNHGAPTRDDTSPAELYAAIVGFVRRQYPVIVFVTLLMIGLGAVYVFTTPPRYTGVAQLIIDTHKLQFFQPSPQGGNLPIDSAIVDSQVEILKSEKIALSVIKDLHLTDDPEFVGPGGGLVGTILQVASEIFASDEPASEYKLLRRAVEHFEGLLTIKRVGLTYVIEIDYESLAPERAAQVANAIADAYVVNELEAKYESARRAAVWLQDRMTELRQQASTAERAVVDFKEKNNIVDTGGRLMNEQQLAELNSAFIQARAQTAESKARFDRIEAILRNGTSDDKFANTATVVETLHDEVITKLRQQFVDYAAKEADWSNRYGRNHLSAVNMRNQMFEIRKSILEELKRIAETYRSDYEIAKTHVDAVQKDLDEIVSQSNMANQAQIVLHEFDSSAQSYRALADNFLQRYMESVQQQSFPITESRLITQASLPLKKSHPKTLLVLAISAAGGLILAFGMGMLREISDRVFRTSSQVETDLQTDCIAVLPAVKGGGTQAAPLPTNDETPCGLRTIVRDQSLLWHVADAPFSRFTESIRAIKMACDLVEVSRSNKVIAITSSLPNEGKSTIAVALAQLMAHGGSRVILVDCDLRNPSLTSKLAPSASLGLIEIISGKAALEDVTWTDFSTKLTFLPAVVKSPIAHTSEILRSPATRMLFDRLRETYDYVIVDLSPLAPVVDVRATTNLVDSYVFVIEWGRTKIDVVERALNAARGVYDSLLGVVLNKVDINVLSRYESYRGKYGYT